MVFKMKRKYKPRLHNNDDDTLHLFASLLLQSICQTATKRSNLLFVSLQIHFLNFFYLSVD